MNELLSVRRKDLDLNLDLINGMFMLFCFFSTDIESEEIIASDSLELVDLRKNPLTPQCLDRLRNARVSFHIQLPERIKEDWEDLDV